MFWPREPGLKRPEPGQAAAKAAFYPDLSLAAFIGTDATSIDNLFAAPSRTYGIGPALHLPLFEGGRLHANYRGATAQIDDAIANYNATVFQAVSQAADQLSLVEALRKEVADQQAALEAAERAYHLAEERYEAGLSGYLTVLSAETQLLNARRQRVELGSDDAIARVSLLLAVGGSFDPEKPATDWVAAK
jgi:outer membrane protein TolC